LKKSFWKLFFALDRELNWRRQTQKGVWSCWWSDQAQLWGQ